METVCGNCLERGPQRLSSCALVASATAVKPPFACPGSPQHHFCRTHCRHRHLCTSSSLPRGTTHLCKSPPAQDNCSAASGILAAGPEGLVASLDPPVRPLPFCSLCRHRHRQGPLIAGPTRIPCRLLSVVFRDHLYPLPSLAPDS